MKRILLVLIFICTLGCSSSQNFNHSNDSKAVLELLLSRVGDEDKIYYEAINISPNHPIIERKVVVQDMSKIIINSNSSDHLNKLKSALDTISVGISSEKRLEIEKSIKNSFKISPNKLFSLKDRDYMVEQLEDESNFNFKKFLKDFKYRFSKSDSSIKISLPLFNLGNNLALIFIDYGSSETIEVYKKNDNQWSYHVGSTLLIE